MKKPRISRISLILLPILLCSSCGVETRGWPRIRFPFKTSEVDSASVRYQKYEVEFDDTLEFHTEEHIGMIMKLIGCYPYEFESQTNIDYENWKSKIVINFNVKILALDRIEIKSYQFYEYGITDGKVVLDDCSVHYLPGDISAIYTEMRPYKYSEE